MAQRRIRVGIVGANGGTDRWGARAHIPAVMALPEAELTAVCTAHEETAKHAQQRTGAPLAFWDYRDMMQSPQIDLVTVSVRISMHHSIVLAALQAGKHVFCEWPLALNASQATGMYKLADEKGAYHAVGTQARFSPGIMYGKELMEQGYVGRPLLVHMNHFLSSALEPRPSHRWWSMRAEEGGGAILIACGHALDVVRWYLGEVEEVCGKVETLVKETQFSDTGEVVPVTAIDTVAFMARLASGVTGTVHVSNVCKRGSGFRLEVYGTEGRLLVESSHMVQYSPARVYGARGKDEVGELSVPARLLEVTGLSSDSQALQVAQLLRRFIRAINEGAGFHPNFAEAVSLHRTIEAVVRSSKTGTWEPSTRQPEGSLP
ncbi:MAG: Gfo/Idh/MocA family oxidoreductase [Nitrospinae bacterium]|nr:Gfo/Idh/MocA family oxidoreductase [Nitrospinota bacterium]